MADNHKDTEGTEKIIDFAPYGWAVYELSCVNCGKEWVCVAPYLVTDLSICDYCGKNKNILDVNFKRGDDA
jgi:hypothetical protein